MAMASRVLLGFNTVTEWRLESPCKRFALERDDIRGGWTLYDLTDSPERGSVIQCGSLNEGRRIAAGLADRYDDR